MSDGPSMMERIRRVVLGRRTPDRRGLSSMIDLDAIPRTYPIGQTKLGPVDGPAESEADESESER